MMVGRWSDDVDLKELAQTLIDDGFMYLNSRGFITAFLGPVNKASAVAHPSLRSIAPPFATLTPTKLNLRVATCEQNSSRLVSPFGPPRCDADMDGRVSPKGRSYLLLLIRMNHLAKYQCI
ncbi:hypothetical protein QQ045_031862 [Rhodiola kirilowii]